ncbi:MAG TPA: cyanophycin synthetase [Parafilimonas sp.]|nr:cyanophycin synthetase [Parafilimonas sp.]
MKILELKVMRGPNYWSTYRQKLIVMKLDLEESEEFPTNKIDGFADRIQELIPTLYSHRCSEGKPGGFFERVRQGTWMGHVIEHIALEIQSLAGMQCGFGRTRSTNKSGVYHVVFSYQVENAGLYAAKAAVRIAQALESDIHYDIAKDIKELSRINKNEGLGPSTQAIVNEAVKKGIPYKRIDNDSLLRLGQGIHQKLIRATMACTTSSIGVDIASDKEETKRILAESFIPLPRGKDVATVEELDEVIRDLGYPIVIKPVNGNHGRGVTTNILSKEKAYEAFEVAHELSDKVIVEKFVRGIDYRFLVVNYKLVAVAKRTPAMVMGDDKSTIKELIDDTNNDPRRGEDHENVLTTIKVDNVTNSILVQKNLTLNSVLPLGEILFLKDTANISTGGTAKDVSDVVHPYNVFLAERIARLMNLDICGIDVIAEDIAIPITEKNGAVLEVNAGPGFRMHLSPSIGPGRNVAEPLIKMLFPPGSASRIPIVAVTGTNGKTTVTRLIAHIASQAGQSVGYTTTDGIYIQNQPVFFGDCSGPSSAEVVLRDPIVDFAVLECARGGILRSGLGFDKCNVGIVTNISEDHLGLDEIHSLRELAKVKSVVPRSVFNHGYAVLNADDDLVFKMQEDLDCKIALFSMDADNDRIQEHCENGGLAAIVEKGYITICKGEWRTRIAKIKEIPLTFSGRAQCMVQNILPAILTAVIYDFKIDTIRAALRSFIPSAETTPGRMNIFKFRNFDFMIDYAHNVDSLRQLKTFIDQTTATAKIGIIASPGDRRDEDIRNLGFLAGKIFDEIIIRHDKDGRGRTKEQLTQLTVQGIMQANAHAVINIISDELEAIQYAMDNAKKGSFIVLLSDKVQESIEYVSGLLKNEKQEKQKKQVNQNSYN